MIVEFILEPWINYGAAVFRPNCHATANFPKMSAMLSPLLWTSVISINRPTVSLSFNLCLFRFATEPVPSGRRLVTCVGCRAGATLPPPVQLTFERRQGEDMRVPPWPLT